MNSEIITDTEYTNGTPQEAEQKKKAGRRFPLLLIPVLSGFSCRRRLFFLLASGRDAEGPV